MLRLLDKSDSAHLIVFREWDFDKTMCTAQIVQQAADCWPLAHKVTPNVTTQM